eukprot:COSAG03_NODE_528_length_7143_cov_7.192930_2_plen_53_part_00
MYDICIQILHTNDYDRCIVRSRRQYSVCASRNSANGRVRGVPSGLLQKDIIS